MKNKYVIIGLLITAFFLGMFTYRADFFPRPQLKQLRLHFYPPPVPPKVWSVNKIMTPYTIGVPLYIDRGFYDTVGDPRLEGDYVLQISRHLKHPIEVELHRDVLIYRVLTDSNDNSIFNDWDKTDINIGMRGATCVHAEVVSKMFSPGRVFLEPGGPVASSPIIIRELSDTVIGMPLTIVNKNRLIKTQTKKP